jgi:hypothetical protein
VGKDINYYIWGRLESVFFFGRHSLFSSLLWKAMQVQVVGIINGV